MNAGAGLSTHSSIEAPGAAASWTARLFTALAGLVLLASVLSTPLTDDLMMSFASAFQADHVDAPFPANVYRSWHQRGIGYRCLIYGLYRAAAVVTDTTRPARFELVVKVLYYGLLLLLTGAWCRAARSALARLGVTPFEAFAVCALAILTCSHSLQMQAEELAVVLALGMTAMAVSESRRAQWMSGLFVPLLFSCKFVTVAYAALPVAVLFAMGPTRRAQLLRVLAASAAGLAATAAIWMAFLPLELTSARNAALLQSALKYTQRGVLDGFLFGLGRAIQHAPFFAMSLLLGAILAFRPRAGAGKRAALFAGMFAACAAVAVVQSKWFPYHYTGFLLFGFLVCGAAVASAAPGRRNRWLGAIAGVTLCVWALSILVLRDGPGRNPDANSGYYALFRYEPRMRMLREIDARFALGKQESMLFLSDGVPNYVIRCPSYLQYFYPHPLQRVRFNPALASTQLHRSQLAAALAYRGEYVLLEPAWFDLKLLPELERKLETEYEPVFTASRTTAAMDTVLLRRRSGL